MPRVVQKAHDIQSIGNIAHRSEVKEELLNPAKQVFHRKSERRRIARDIFLVFEEQPSSRRSRNFNKRSGKKRPKFAHLKVEDPQKTKTLLRDIKNEPKGFGTFKATNKKKNLKTLPLPLSPPPLNDMVKNSVICCNTTKSSIEAKNEQVARVNPIFLWVKQDDTRIVEVRCEDYDKRNRICLTKTTNGWRAIPRTDTSTRIVKFFKSPKYKIKREFCEIDHTAKGSPPNLAKNESTSSDTLYQKLPLIPDRQSLNLQLSCEEVNDNAKAFKYNVEGHKKKHRSRTKLKVKDVHALLSFHAEKEDCKYRNKECMNQNETTLDLYNVDEKDYISELEMSSPAINKPQKKDTANELESGAEVDSESEVDSKTNSLYTYHKRQLCPKTGLFLPNPSTNEEFSNGNQSPICKSIFLDLFNCDEIASDPRQSEDCSEIGLDPQTRHLKDLLDDEDLLQHCSDNASSGEDLIDSLVKSSCESNLIAEPEEEELVVEGLTSSVRFNTSHTASKNLKSIAMSEINLPQIIDNVNEPPKCLSFNEAGEIEGINEEIYHSNAYLAEFDKETIICNDIDVNTTQLLTNVSKPIHQPHILRNQSLLSEVSTDDTPKDLRNKKQDEVCLVSDSRSQCAVTSSSDVVNSPRQGDPNVVKSATETIQNILGQFMNLNNLNSLAVTPNKPPLVMDNNRSSSASVADSIGVYVQTDNVIDTVIIEDNSNDEPLKKRLRNTIVNINEHQKEAIIDTDPDPLTQLQLLIKSSQWKVPDPILVPKDRLGAVLASPAREIPLLITTRPELRLPEAFAYPEIIQNPNILVISMGQLEAILKNEIEIEKVKENKTDKELSPDPKRKEKQTPQTSLTSLPSPLQSQQKSNTINRKEHADLKSHDSRSNCSHSGPNLPSDVSAATLAVLNQMIWLPFFGQLSQEFLKPIKSTSSMALASKYSTLVPSIYNHSIVLQHLEELYKNYMRQITSTKTHQSELNSINNYSSEPSSTPIELSVFQKVVEHQMQNILQVSSLNSKATSPLNNIIPESSEHESKDEENCSRKSMIDSLTQPKSLHRTEFKKDYLTRKKTTVVENKPRLTCKSLSNLLEPESEVPTTMIPLANLNDTLKKKFESNRQRQLIEKGFNFRDSKSLSHSEGSCRSNVKQLHTIYMPPSVTEPTPLSMDPRRAVSRGVNSHSSSNPALWHPLFGNNIKNAYSSPWQWTTVTATGE